MRRKIVVFGNGLAYSWDNDHAATHRGLLREMAAKGHKVVFVERDGTKDANLTRPTCRDLVLYDTLDDLNGLDVLDDADFAIIGSCVPDGVEVGEWVLREARCPVAFYDDDTPATLAKLDRGDCGYLSPKMVGRYAIYLSTTGGPTLDRLMLRYGSPKALPLYCSFDPSLYYPEDRERRYDLGYIGADSNERQPLLERLMIDAARQWGQGRFVVVGPQCPSHLEWPANVERMDHLSPSRQRAFYNSQRFTLNVERPDCAEEGWSPSAGLFEAAACGVPIIGDGWAGLSDFFVIGREILVSTGTEQTLRYLRRMPEGRRREIGERARQRVLREHTSAHRAEQLEGYIDQCLATRAVTLL